MSDDAFDPADFPAWLGQAPEGPDELRALHCMPPMACKAPLGARMREEP